MSDFLRNKKLALGIIDTLLLLWSFGLSVVFSLMLKAEAAYHVSVNEYISFLALYLVINLVLFNCFGMYKSLWQLAGLDEFIKGLTGCLIGCLISIFIISIMEVPLLPIVLLASFFNCNFILGIRVVIRIYRRMVERMVLRRSGKKQQPTGKRTMIIGAGYSGSALIKSMLRPDRPMYEPIIFIDDDSTKLGSKVWGIEVVGDRNYIEQAVKEYNIELIMIAIPTLSRKGMKELIEVCTATKQQIQVMPSFDEIMGKEIGVKQMREVDVKDLLGRDPVKLDKKDISKTLHNKVVLVTGGGGSIGSELCRQIANFEPRKLIIVDIYENNAYDIQNELKSTMPKLNLEVLIASVRDFERMDEILNLYHPQVIFHAAAHKHVPLMEDSPKEAIKNNVKGTLNMAELAHKHRVHKFILISTDKAVNPTNVMGASKRLCEMVVQGMNKKSQTTEYAAVRFGNVLGSNGSVIPLFKKQIKDGGPVTLTHKDIIRYFMLIPEAAQLVLQAATYAKGGEIFVLDMGEPVKIYDLACDLIRLSGFEPEVDIPIKIVGLRPGEKLYEELLMSEEGLGKTRHQKIFIGKSGDFDIESLKQSIESIVTLDDMNMFRTKLQEIVPTYVRQEGSDLIAASGE